jgi:hypothetical protein
LEANSIRNPQSVEEVTFERGSQIRRLDPGAFDKFHSLKSICIAASVEVLAANCFFWLRRPGGPRADRVVS